jgi:branched-chain amino acid transport system permease protein
MKSPFAPALARRRRKGADDGKAGDGAQPYAESPSVAHAELAETAGEGLHGLAPTFVPDLPVLWRLAGAGALVLLAVAIGSFASPFWIDIANLVCIAAIAAIGLDIVLGHTGLVSVGNAAFLGIGALTVALLNRGGEPFPVPLALLAAGGICAVVGVVVAMPSLRIAGLYLAIATLAFHFIAVWAIREIQTEQVGDTGFVIPIAKVLGIELFELRNWYVFLVIMLGVVLVVHRALLLRKPGRSWHAIRERPALAAMSGISIWRYKVAAFAISSFLIGLAGGLNAYYIGNVSYTNFTLHLAIEYLAMVIVGGLGSTYGALFGAAFIVSLPHLVREAREALNLEGVVGSTDIFFVQGAIVGLVVVVVIIFQPRGLAAIGTGVRGLFSRTGERRR